MNPACDGKYAYAAQTDAENIARLQSHRRHKQIVAYKCSICGWYHVGTRLGKKFLNSNYKEKV